MTRHYLTIAGRRVHYRRCGSGPPLLMVHQSPRSSAEFDALMQGWGRYFTCIAPDTPGFGQSDPLPNTEPDIADFADALAAFIRALGLERVAAYGFHSGGIILVAALGRHPTLFHGLAIGGYAVWTAAEMGSFGEHYLPPFRPSPYGEHLTWLWQRILEQSWFFPWFDVRDASRLAVAHDDPARIHAIVMDMLDAGDAYRAGYGAVLRAPRSIPPADAAVPPVLITAYDGDPLQAHIDRLGKMPCGWRATKVGTPAEHHQFSLDFLRALPGEACSHLAQDGDAGFVAISSENFDGLVHWRRSGDGTHLATHAPGGSLELAVVDGIFIDAAGHGLTSPWLGTAPCAWADWAALFAAVADQLGAQPIRQWPVAPCNPDRYFPDLTPNRFGSHLTAAWGIVRAAAMFDPWYEGNAAHAVAIDPDAIRPERLAIAHRALIRATAARAFARALNEQRT